MTINMVVVLMITDDTENTMDDESRMFILCMLLRTYI